MSYMLVQYVHETRSPVEARSIYPPIIFCILPAYAMGLMSGWG